MIGAEWGGNQGRHAGVANLHPGSGPRTNAVLVLRISMAYSFERRGNAAKQVRKIARDQVESGLALARAGGDFDKTVHDLRRRCKKVRGLLRIVRPRFSEFDRENAHFRNAAAALSPARDAAVMVETLREAMSQSWASPIADADKARLAEALEKNAASVAAGLNRAQVLADFAGAMEEVLPRIEDWSLKGDDFDLIEPGLSATYDRMRKRMKKARKSGRPEDFHDWRKDSKYHWFHISLLRESAPDVLGGRRSNLDTLGELLGDHHNLHVLLETIDRLVPNAAPPILDGLRAEQEALGDRALVLGQQLNVETAEQLTTRLRHFWQLLPEKD